MALDSTFFALALLGTWQSFEEIQILELYFLLKNKTKKERERGGGHVGTEKKYGKGKRKRYGLEDVKREQERREGEIEERRNRRKRGRRRCK